MADGIDRFHDIEVALREAQRAGNEIALGTLRMVIAALKNREIEKRSAGKPEKLNGDEFVEVLQREAKKRREAIEAFRKGGREDLAKKEEAELAVLAEYLPPQMSRDEVKTEVMKITKSGGDFKMVMKDAMARLKGRADGKLVGEVVKEVLGL